MKEVIVITFGIKVNPPMLSAHTYRDQFLLKECILTAKSIFWKEQFVPDGAFFIIWELFWISFIGSSIRDIRFRASVYLAKSHSGSSIQGYKRECSEFIFTRKFHFSPKGFHLSLGVILFLLRKLPCIRN